AYKDEQLHEEKVFKDPVHRYVHVRDRVIWDLIATPEFQRLRRIKQLGTTHLTFHGAEHSRFNHSLGVYEIVRRIINNFQGRDRKSTRLNSSHVSISYAVLSSKKDIQNFLGITPVPCYQTLDVVIIN